MSVPESKDGWKRCPTGTISNLVNRTKIESRRAALQRGAVGVGAVLFTGLSGAYVVSKSGLLEPEAPVMLACSEVARLLPDYVDGELSEKLCAQIKLHLDACPHCEEHRQTLAAGQHHPR